MGLTPSTIPTMTTTLKTPTTPTILTTPTTLYDDVERQQQANGTDVHDDDVDENDDNNVDVNVDADDDDNGNIDNNYLKFYNLKITTKHDTIFMNYIHVNTFNMIYHHDIINI